RLHVTRAHKAGCGYRDLGGVHRALTLYGKPHVNRTVAKREVGCSSGGDDPGQRLNTLQRLREKRGPLRVLPVLVLGQVHSNTQQIVRSKAEIDFLKTLKTLEHETAANKQCHRDGDF